jgi:hypothetical protein
MIKFKHDGLQITYWKACWKQYDGANVLKWNPKIEPFVAQWIIRKEENMHELGVGEECKALWNVTIKGKCCCWFVLRLPKKKTLIECKLNNYN